MTILSGIIREDDFDDMELIKGSIDDELIKLNIEETPSLKFIKNYNQPELDFAFLDVMIVPDHYTVEEALQLKKNNPEMLVGFITNYPEMIKNKREYIDFIIFKYRMEDEDYKILLRKLILIQKLNNLKAYYNELFNAKNEQRRQNYKELLSKCYNQIIQLKKYFDDFRNSEENEIIGYIEDIFDERLLVTNKIYSDFICPYFESKFFKIIKTIVKYEGLLFYKVGNNIIKSDLFNFVNTKLVTIEDVINKIDQCEFEEEQLKEHCFNKKALEIKFTLRDDILLNELNIKYLFYRVVQNIPFEIEVAIKIKENNDDIDPSKDFITYAIYPSGCMRLFGNLHYEKDKILITEEELELFFDPNSKISSNKIEKAVEYKFWILLLGF